MPTQIPPLTTTPDRLTDSQTEFNSKMVSLFDSMEPYRNGVNTLAIEVEGYASNAEASKNTASAQATLAQEAVVDCQAEVVNAQTAASESSDYADLSKASANFKGLWSNLTGAITTEGSVYHSGKFWRTSIDLADITTKEPGVDSEWIETTEPLAAINKIISDTDIVDIFIYDTSKDSDGGKACKVAGLPSIMMITASATEIKTYNLSVNDIPVIKIISRTGKTCKKVTAINGKIYTASTTGVFVDDLINDITGQSEAYATDIIALNCNDIAVESQESSPVVNGLQTETIAVATDGNGTYLVSVIQPDGNIYDICAASTYTAVSVSFDGPRLTVLLSNGEVRVWHDVRGITSDGVDPDETYSSSTDVAVYGAAKIVSPGPNKTILIGSDKGLNVLKPNPSTPTEGMNAIVTDEVPFHYQSPICVLDVLASTTPGTIVGGEVVENGNFDADVSGWSFSGSGSISWDAGTILLESLSGYGYAYQSITVTIGIPYSIKSERISSTFSNALSIYADELLGDVIYDTGADAPQSYSDMFVPTTNTIVVSIRLGDIGTTRWDNISIKPVDIDYSGKQNHAEIVGEITKSFVADGAEMVGYGPYSKLNYLKQSYLYGTGSGDFYISGWINTDNAYCDFLKRAVHGSQTPYLSLSTGSAGTLLPPLNTTTVKSAEINLIGIGWAMLVLTRSGDDILIYVNGIVDYIGTSSFDYDIADSYFGIGAFDPLDSTGYAPQQHKSCLWRVGNIGLSERKIKEIYETERHRFLPNDKCTIYGDSSDVIDMSYDDTTGISSVIASGGVSRFNKNGALISQEDLSVGTPTSISTKSGMIATGGSAGTKVYVPAISLRGELQNQKVSNPLSLEGFWFTGDNSETEFALEEGWTPKFVYQAGLLVKPGAAEVYTIKDDGFVYSIAFAVAPGTDVDICVMAAREV